MGGEIFGGDEIEEANVFILFLLSTNYLAIFFIGEIQCGRGINFRHFILGFRGN